MFYEKVKESAQFYSGQDVIASDHGHHIRKRSGELGGHHGGTGGHPLHGDPEFPPVSRGQGMREIW